MSKARQGKSRWVKTSGEKSKQGAWHGKSPSMATWHGMVREGSVARSLDRTKSERAR